MSEQRLARLVSSLTRMDSPSPLNFRAAQAATAYGQGIRPQFRPQFHPQAQPDARAELRGTAPNNSPRNAASPQASNAARFTASGTIIPPLARESADANPMRVGRRPDALAPNLAAMVAGQVDSPVARGAGFDAPAAMTAAPASRPTAPAAYAMYTRAADRVEVATGLSVGRTLDARG